MKKRSVRKRIFLSNTLMVVVTLVIFLAVNLLIIRGYSESAERRFEEYGRHGREYDDIEDAMDAWESERDQFILAFTADGVICIVSLFVVSQVFTRNLTKHIMKPLDALTQGARRIGQNDLSRPVEYTGDLEFENVCRAFNDMQASILHAQEKNRRYEKARTDMIAGISHDLRTPLTAIRGTIKGLLDKVVSTPQQQEKFLNAAYRRTGEMDVLLNRLLYLSRMETGNMHLYMQKVDISSFVLHYVQSKQDITDPDREVVTVDAQNVTTEVLIDPEQFTRILDNLLENSRKYAETQPLVVHIILQTQPGKVVICFHDNGVGVPKDKLAHIFEEFYRADASRNKKEGNGLGLYIVKYLVEAMGGRAWAENNSGFAVYLELPVCGEGTEDGTGQENSDCGR